MKLSQKNISIIFTLSLVSVVTFAISVGQNIEIMEFLNARARANFIEPAVNNRRGVLTPGTKAEVKQVKRLRSGNSGLYVTVTDGPLAGQDVWIYYNRRSPALQLASVSGTPIREPAVSATGVAVRPIAATPDPVLSPVSGTGAVSETPQVIPPPPPPPPPSPSPVAAGTVLPGLIDQANGVVGGGMNAGGNSGCRDCAGGVSGAASSTVVPAPAPIPPAPIPAPVAASPGDATDPGLLYFSELDGSARPPAGASAAVVRAHKFAVLNGNIRNAGLVCDIAKHSTLIPVGALMPDGSGRRVTVPGYAPRTQAERDAEAADINSFINRWNTYMAGAGAPVMSEFQTGMGGARAMDRSSQMTSYASGSRSSSDSQLRGNNQQYCAGILPEFNAITRMSAQELRAYIDMPDAQRLAYLKSRVGQ